MTQTNNKFSRNVAITRVLIAVAILLIIVIAAIAGAVLFGRNPTIKQLQSQPPLPQPLDFKMNISSTSGTALQGESKSLSVTLTYLSGERDSIALSGDGGSSGVQFSFNPASGSPSFTSGLTINVPASTPTKTYSLVISSRCGSVTRVVAYTLSVLSAKVQVLGTVTTVGFGTHPTQIQFVDTQTQITYTGTMSGNSYYINLQNQHTYNVIVYWQGLLGSSGTFRFNGFYVYAAVGYTSMQKDFTG